MLLISNPCVERDSRPVVNIDDYTTQVDDELGINGTLVRLNHRGRSILELQLSIPSNAICGITLLLWRNIHAPNVATKFNVQCYGAPALSLDGFVPMPGSQSGILELDCEFSVGIEANVLEIAFDPDISHAMSITSWGRVDFLISANHLLGIRLNDLTAEERGSLAFKMGSMLARNRGA